MCLRYCCVDPNYLISKFIVFKVTLNLSKTLIRTGHPQFNTDPTNNKFYCTNSTYINLYYKNLKFEMPTKQT